MVLLKVSIKKKEKMCDPKTNPELALKIVQKNQLSIDGFYSRVSQKDFIGLLNCFGIISTSTGLKIPRSEPEVVSAGCLYNMNGCNECNITAEYDTPKTSLCQNCIGLAIDMLMFSFIDEKRVAIFKDCQLVGYSEPITRFKSLPVHKVLVANGFSLEVANIIKQAMIDAKVSHDHDHAHDHAHAHRVSIFSSDTAIFDNRYEVNCKACNDYCVKPFPYICKCYIEHCVIFPCSFSDSESESELESVALTAVASVAQSTTMLTVVSVVPTTEYQ